MLFQSITRRRQDAACAKKFHILINEEEVSLRNVAHVLSPPIYWIGIYTVDSVTIIHLQ